ncbi:sigma-70 family RNA polymerase sigma factor [Cytophagales bacterium LB-30]|uniref:RNA polymerase sigma factor n=1 Tax=Shiella aurantiaca TaxID=3058365 RepID=A0ABT8F355_9BACT|nr:sigma-70 family RNA polymerase sigma factor [Shiella aurantiaca]MDN4164855.1 sigma-70 family RNA polymerase sigma factor [Shiella aurantiaca]
MEEKELIQRLKNPESKRIAFHSLVRIYQRKVYALVRKMVIDHSEADDVTQEVFLKVWLHLDGFKENSRLYTWIYRIATNECLAYLRKKRIRFFLPIGDVEQQLITSLERQNYISGDEIESKLQKALLKLPDKQRLVFNLKYYEDLSYEDMAEITQTSIGALKASYHLAVKKIENSLMSD